MARQYNFDETPTKLRSNLNVSPKPVLSEWRLALIGLILSLIIISTKLYTLYSETIINALTEQRLISYDVITDEGQVMLKFAWTTVVKYSHLWLPIICGVLATHFTWLMVYLDSDKPGEQPPSPFSPTKIKARSGHWFHLNYIFAVLIGVFVASYMYWRKYELVY